jgi:hypothetical protein
VKTESRILLEKIQSLITAGLDYNAPVNELKYRKVSIRHSFKLNRMHHTLANTL